MKHVMRFAPIFAAWCGLASIAAAQEAGLEYRLEKKIGMPLDFADGTTKFFHELPFMTGKDFARAMAVKSRNPNTPGTFDVEVLHNAIGKLKFRAVADADRERSYCVVFRVVRGCAGFAPPMKDIYDRGSTLYGMTQSATEKLAAEINRSLRVAR
jgi:hypothetical protein